MHRIDGAGHVGHMFVLEDTATSRPPTEVTDAWLNAVQEEVCHFIESQGFVLDKNDNTQLTKAIQKAIQQGQHDIVFDNSAFAPAVAGTGKAVYWDSGNNRFDLALADGSAKQNVVGFADVPNAKVYAFGWASIFAGLTPGRYYLDAATAGAITTVAPANTVFIGIAKTATDLFIDIDAVGFTQAQADLRYALLSGAAFTGAVTGPTAAQFDNSTKLMTSAFAKRMGLESSGRTIITTSAAIPSTCFGGLVVFNAAGAIVPTLPAANSAPAGARIHFKNINTGTATLTRSGADTIVKGRGAAVNTIDVGTADTLTLETDGATYWTMVDGSAADQFAAAFLNAFSASIAASGYQVLPSGLILQWGLNTNLSAGVDYTWTFPIAFPTASLFAAVQFTQSGAVGKTSVTSNLGAANKASITYRCTSDSPPGHVFLFAIGY